MLRFPSHWIPKVSLDEGKVEGAMECYRWVSDIRNFKWVGKDDLVIVGTYLVYHYTDSYWEIILDDGVRGYSLYLHELIELKWYAERNLNPFDATVQIKHYPEAHSLGLLVEHRFLQVVAQATGYDFSLRELILGNPHGDPPQRDWDDVQKHYQRELSQADAAFDPNHEPQVQEFYHCLGFRKVV